MKRTLLISTLVFAAGTLLASASYAQGRHDEKPHGSTKPSTTSPEGKYEPGMGGRHDERPHGTRKKTDAKKSGAKPADAPAEAVKSGK
jgi:hypothetical protein